MTPEYNEAAAVAKLCFIFGVCFPITIYCWIVVLQERRKLYMLKRRPFLVYITVIGINIAQFGKYINIFSVIFFHDIIKTLFFRCFLHTNTLVIYDSVSSNILYRSISIWTHHIIDRFLHINLCLDSIYIFIFINWCYPILVIIL